MPTSGRMNSTARPPSTAPTSVTSSAVAPSDLRMRLFLPAPMLVLTKVMAA